MEKIRYAHQILHPIPKIAGGLSTALGLVVLVGWYTNNITLIQVFPIFVPMQFNTAIGFLICGIGILSQSFGRNRLAMACGLTAVVIGFLTLLQYIFNVNLGIDQLLMKHYITVKTSQPGRMAPNTALCFAITGAALLILSRVKRTRQNLMVIGILGSITMALGVVSFFGYLSGVETAYGWGNLTRMAVHTAAGFMALGIGIFAFAWFEGMVEDTWIPDWIAFPAGIGMATVALTEWQALNTQLGAEHSSLPVFVLVTGLLMTVLLVVTIQLAQISWRRAKDVEQINWKLENEIIERKQTDEALRESEDKFRSFAEQSLVGIYLISDDVFKYVNPKFAEIFGYSVDECLDNMHFPQLVHPEDLATVQKQVGRRLSGETKAVRYSFRGIKKNGETIHVEIFGSSMLLKGKSVATGTMLDITESKRAEASLQREKENLSTTLDNNPNGIVLFDNNGKWIYANPMFTKITGYTPEDIKTGRQWFQKAYPDVDYRKKVIGAWKNDSKQAGRGDNYEFNVTCKDGQVKQIEFRATHLADRSVSVLTDVTQRKKIEKSLYEAKLFLDNISDLAYMADTDGNVIYANPAAENITGLALNEIIDRPLLPLIVEKDHNLLTKVYNRTLAGESLENIVTFNSGIACHFTSLPFKDNYGNIIGTFGIARDISDRLDAEEALKESEGRLKKAQSVAKLGNWEYDISTRKIWGSEQAFRIYGIERTSPYLPLDRVEACIPDAPRVGQALVDLLQENKRYDIEFEVQQEVSGETILIHSIAELVYENGMPVKVLGVIQDVTEQKQAEKERKDLEDQLQHAQKMEAIGTLAGGVAHDLNNILGGLVSQPELLLLQLPEDGPLRKSILTIQKSGEKAAAVVQDLLTLARRGVVVTEVVNPNDIIAEYLKSPEHENIQSYHPGVHLETHLAADTLNILGSSTHLSKTVMNLISNAAEAMPVGGKIVITTKNRYIDRPIRGYDNVKEGDYVVLTVSDTGTGIAPDDMEKIFEPFYTKKKMGRSGTGLGMAVVWGTVKDHNGYIHVQSTEGRGTTFTLYFPVTRKSLEERSEISVREYTGKGEAVLVVDDVEEQRKIASGMLKELGYSVVSVSSEEEAVEYLKANKVDLLVLDMIMDPGMDGLETYKKIIELHPGQKAIIASGFSETDRVKEVQSLGAGAYIRKPLLLEKIGVAVKEELEKQAVSDTILLKKKNLDADERRLSLIFLFSWHIRPR